MRAPSRAASLTVVLALGVAAAASAQEAAAPTAKPAPQELTLTWQAPATCPAPADVEAQFARLLGGAARVPTGKHVTATAAVHVAAPGRWILELTTVLDGAGGKRSLSGDSCASVASAAALILALMIDPAAAERAGTVEEPPPPPPPKPAPPPPTLVAPPPPAPPFLQPSARAFLGGVFLLLPEPTLAAGVAVGARHEHVAAELTFLATTERRGETAAGVGGDFRLLAGGARACGVVGQRVLYQLCLGGELERLAGVGSALEPPDRGPPTATMLAGTGSGLVAIPLAGPLALTIELGVAARTYRPTFTATVADVVTPVFRVPALSASGAAGLSLSL